MLNTEIKVGQKYAYYYSDGITPYYADRWFEIVKISQDNYIQFKPRFKEGARPMPIMKKAFILSESNFQHALDKKYYQLIK